MTHSLRRRLEWPDSAAQIERRENPERPTHPHRKVSPLSTTLFTWNARAQRTLTLRAQGYTNEEIAARLGADLRTVEDITAHSAFKARLAELQRAKAADEAMADTLLAPLPSREAAQLLQPLVPEPAPAPPDVGAPAICGPHAATLAETPEQMVVRIDRALIHAKDRLTALARKREALDAGRERLLREVGAADSAAWAAAVAAESALGHVLAAKARLLSLAGTPTEAAAKEAVSEAARVAMAATGAANVAMATLQKVRGRIREAIYILDAEDERLQAEIAAARALVPHLLQQHADAVAAVGSTTLAALLLPLDPGACVSSRCPVNPKLVCIPPPLDAVAL
jgi:hypothetical protein